MLIALSLPLHLHAQEVATQFSFGHTNLLDTYLSPEKYHGFEFRFTSEVLRDSKRHALTTSLRHEGRFATTGNRSGYADELSGGYNFTYGLMYRTTIYNNKVRVRVGGMADYYLGFTYNTRTSANNPAQGYMSLGIGPQLMLSTDVRAWSKTLTISWEGRMPLVGIMFSPNYGQSYYEIFNEGDYDHNIVFTSIAVPQLEHQLTVDMPLSRRYSLRLGYLGDYRQAKPNNLKQHTYYHAATIGFVKKM